MKVPEHVTVTSEMIEQFCKEFIEEIQQLKNTLSNFGINIVETLPEALRGKSVVVEAVFLNWKLIILLWKIHLY